MIPGVAVGDWERVESRQLGQPGPGVSLEELQFLRSGRETPSTLHLLRFDDRTHTLRVVDREDRNDRLTLADAMRRGGFLGGVNGGYFHPDFRPAGMVVSGGRVIQEPEQARLLSGVLAVTADRILLLRSGEYRFGENTIDGLQAGPFLVDHGQAVEGLESSRRARRTFIAHDGAHGWILGMTSALTLAELGEILSNPGFADESRVQRALNLDGGSSSGIWAADPTGSDFYRPGLSQVRNYIGIVPR